MLCSDTRLIRMNRDIVLSRGISCPELNIILLFLLTKYIIILQPTSILFLHLNIMIYIEHLNDLNKRLQTRQQTSQHFIWYKTKWLTIDALFKNLLIYLKEIIKCHQNWYLNYHWFIFKNVFNVSIFINVNVSLANFSWNV